MNEAVKWLIAVVAIPALVGVFAYVVALIVSAGAGLGVAG